MKRFNFKVTEYNNGLFDWGWSIQGFIRLPMWLAQGLKRVPILSRYVTGV